MSKPDTYMVHSVGANTKINAERFSHNSIQGHHHSTMGVERAGDKACLRWSMTVGCLIDPNSPASAYNRSAVHRRPLLGCGALLGGDVSTLVISDLHLPYQHRDAFDFLQALDNYYQFDRILNVGDLYDHHAGSYHESEPDAYDPETEYKMARKYAHQLQEIFPDMVIVRGNHDKIPQRKLKSAGLPTSVLQDYNQMYGTDEGWEWHDEYWFCAHGAYPITIPMVLNKNGRWDKAIPEIM